VLLSAQQIAGRIAELGRQISTDYQHNPLILLCVLKGSFVFAADLARVVTTDLRIEFLGVRSYGDTTRSSGVVEITQDLTIPVSDADVLIVEDIVDTGLTANYLMRQIESRNPRSVRLCALLDKPTRRRAEVHVHYPGFTLSGDDFVVGYGLDFAQKYRNLPDICVLQQG